MIDKQNIITGVGVGNNIEDWDNDYIDLQYEPAKKEAYLERYTELLNQGLEEDEAEEQANDFVDNEWMYDSCGTDQLYGSWLQDEQDKYYPDPDGEYAMIYDSNNNIYQVVYSKFAIKSYHCSPCYPGQGDIDTEGELIAYCLPPDMMDERWLEENKNRIINL